MGYGDVIPGNSAEKLLAMLGMALGVTVFTYFMDAMGRMLETSSTSEATVGWAGWRAAFACAGRRCWPAA